MKRFLSSADVSKLLADGSEETRAETAAKIGGEYGTEALTPTERAIAEDIMRHLMADTSVRVREALSASLKSCPLLPREMALTLARDVDEVAAPVLEFSPVLSDADLIALLRGSTLAKQVAVASRANVSETLSDTLVASGREEVVARLVANPGAALSEGALAKVLDTFGSATSVTTPMVHRAWLPITVAERLLTLVSDALRQFLVVRHELPAGLADEVVLQTRERAMVGLLDQGEAEADVIGLAEQLREYGRMTPSLIVRALCMGDLTFFEASMATLIQIPLQNARALIHDRGPLGLEAIYTKAGLPEQLFPAVRTAINVIHETALDGQPHDRDRFRVKVMERILTQFEHLNGIGAETLDYLIAKLEKFESEEGRAA